MHVLPQNQIIQALPILPRALMASKVLFEHVDSEDQKTLIGQTAQAPTATNLIGVIDQVLVWFIKTIPPSER